MINKRTIGFYDIKKRPNKRSFSILIKPIGSSCNLRCSYCYYLDKASLYNGKESLMEDSLLEKLTREYIESCDDEVISFNWHGGEPLLAGLDFYKKAIELQKKYRGAKTINNTLQTNGTLLTDEWAQFFRDNNFLVGVSIDGPQAIHDAYRCDSRHDKSWRKVVKGIETLYRNNTQYNTLSTINYYSENKGLEVYQFLKKCGTNFMQFLPVYERTIRGRIASPFESDSQPTSWSVSPQGFGQFLIDIFDYWVKNDVGRFFVQFFDATLANYVGACPQLCAYEELCGQNLIVEHNGDVYICDHFVYQDTNLGNLTRSSLSSLVEPILKENRFGDMKRDALPAECLDCRYLFACRGGCMKHRFNGAHDGKLGKNALCEGYKMFFEHSEPYFRYMADELREGRAPANVMTNYKKQ